MKLLASFRNQESQYLKPLVQRATKTLAAELQVPRLLESPYAEQEKRYGNQLYQSPERQTSFKYEPW